MWKVYQIDENINYTWALEKCQVYVRRKGNNWNFAHIKNGTGTNILLLCQPVESEITADWKRIIAENTTDLILQPALPEKPLVVRPKEPLIILPKKQVQFYFQIPVWLQFYCSKVRMENLLFEVAVEDLSHTWFGDPTDGIYAYAIKNHFEISPDIFSPKPYTVECSILIENDSNQPFDFQNVLIHADQLALFYDNKRLYANDIAVKFKGVGVNSDLVIKSGLPARSKDVKKIAEARNPGSKNIFRRSFYLVKSFTQQ